MDAGLELRDLLRGRSRSTSLDELHGAGPSKVRVIRPEALMDLIQESLPRFAEEMGWVSLDRVEEMVEQGRAELRHLLQTREAEVAAAREHLAEVEALRAREQELLAEIECLRDPAGRGHEGGAFPGASHDAGASEDAPPVMARLLAELAELKQSFNSIGQNLSAQGGGPDKSLADKLQALAEGLDRRLDRMGRAGGGGGRGSEPEIRLDGLFSEDLEKSLESNMADVGVKNRDGKGIGGNLDKIRKLRGSG